MPKNESVLSVGRQVLDCASPLALFDLVWGGAKAAVDCRSPGRYRDGAHTSVIHSPDE